MALSNVEVAKHIGRSLLFVTVRISIQGKRRNDLEAKTVATVRPLEVI
ncbi:MULTISPECIES: hypothetical protein [unclassified Bradyrhizobium]|nr:MULTISPECIES: hypothetical protein [unclassified Bradyrhizobium]MCK1614612.1 hypothetical protein [Bradyrhizobium sp. 163]MCK1763999.1 hypothetical protein [Bradyrhizobium sp. 136]